MIKFKKNKNPIFQTLTMLSITLEMNIHIKFHLQNTCYKKILILSKMIMAKHNRGPYMRLYNMITSNNKNISPKNLFYKVKKSNIPQNIPLEINI